MAYDATLRKARDLDAVKPVAGLEAKLATNTYRPGNASHIRTLWPESIAAHPDMSQAGLWWVCPARVYQYDAPLFGRGKVTVNYENCIKCESCWRSGPDRVLWGRHTDHKLIYRPETTALALLREHLKTGPMGKSMNVKNPGTVDTKLWYLSDDILRSSRAALNASRAVRHAIAKLPAAADKGRKAWPLSLGLRLLEKINALEAALSNDGRYDLAQQLQREGSSIELCLTESRLFNALTT
jgi:ferredoxin-like protein FixX